MQYLLVLFRVSYLFSGLFDRITIQSLEKKELDRTLETPVINQNLDGEV